MKTFGWVVLALVAIIALVLVGILAGRVGGIAIRKQGAAQHPLVVTLSEPVVRGVPTLVHWDNAALPDAATIVFDWRDQFDEYQLGTAPFGEGQTTLKFPCASAGSEGGLVVRTGVDGPVVGNQLVTLAAPGPECVE